VYTKSSALHAGAVESKVTVQANAKLPLDQLLRD